MISVPRQRKLQRPMEKSRIVFLIGVNEDEVERTAFLVGQTGSDPAPLPGAGPLCWPGGRANWPSDFHGYRSALDRHETPGGGQRSRLPDRPVAASVPISRMFRAGFRQRQARCDHFSLNQQTLIAGKTGIGAGF